MSSRPRRAAVLGDPVEHSLSPVLHLAAYRELGLTEWTYERLRCAADELPGLVDGAGSEWVGYSVTMPGKRAALAYADTASPRAVAVGAANTLVRKETGWFADCTDVVGVREALRCAGGFTGGDRGLVLGAGGTAAAVAVAFAELGLRAVDFVVREPARAVETVDAARRAGLEVSVRRWDDLSVRDVDVAVSTVPGAAVASVAQDVALVPCVLDVVYHPWPTPLAQAVLAAGRPVATGLDMLLHQAFDQVAQFTGAEAPREAMRAALLAATGSELPLPLAP